MSRFSLSFFSMPNTFDMLLNTHVDFRTLNVRASEDTKVRAVGTAFISNKHKQPSEEGVSEMNKTRTNSFKELCFDIC
ncbi:hypothetical protein P9112_009120 [Eukaryota sp. TZLM1-RC]